MRKRRFLLLSILLVLLVLSGCLSRNGTEIQTIMLIAEEDESAFRQEMIQGIDAAVSEYTDVNLMKRLSSLDAENPYTQYLEQAIQLNVDGVIVSSSVLTHNEDLLKKMKYKGTSIVLLNAEKESIETYSSVGSDMNQFTQVLEQKLKEKKIKQRSVHILTTKNPHAHYARREQVLNQWTAQGDKRLRFGKNEEENKTSFLTYIKDQQEPIVFIATTESNALQASQLIQEIPQKNRPSLIALDATSSILKEVESGHIQLILRENPFEIGYTSVQSAIERKSFASKNKSKDVKWTAVNQKNLFEPSIQRLLFPLTK